MIPLNLEAKNESQKIIKAYLEENAIVVGELNYETGGRPRMYYYLKEDE